MKRIYFLSILLLAVTVAAQNRFVLVEEFTNTGCGPCASWSPELDAVIENRLGDCVAIKYHSSYPNRHDEFYNYDPDTQQKRHDFYEVTGVPATFVNTSAGCHSLCTESYCTCRGVHQYGMRSLCVMVSRT